AGAVHELATGGDLRPLLLSPVDEPGDVVALTSRDQRAHLRVRVHDVPDLDRLHGRNQLRYDVLEDPRAGEHPRGRRAVLTGVRVAGELQRLDELLDVC